MAENEVTMLEHNHPLFLQAGDAPGFVLIPIGSTVASELMPSIMFASDAKKIWSDFQERFDRSNLTRIYHLWTEIVTVRQNIDSVTTYFLKMKDFWDELDILAPLSSCDCEEARPSIEHLKSQCLLQFLMGLNESYSNIRSNILARRPVVTVNEAYAIVTQEESQRTLGVVDNKEPLNLLAGKAQMVRPKTPGLVCEHCGYKGHLKENYYKIVGYPADFKSKKRSGQQGGVWQNNNFKQGQFRGTNQNNTGFRSYANNTASERQVQGHFFIEEEYSQLMGLLNKSPQEGCSSNMAGTVSLLSNTYSCEWIVDSGASHHTTPCIELLQELRHIDKLQNSKVQVPTGGRSHALYSGKVMGIGRENSGLYILKRGMESPLGAAVTKNEDMATLWHLSLGHLSVGAMKHIPLLKDKVTDKIQEECMFAAVVKRLRSDNGTEFFNSQCNELFTSHGIVHQSSCPYTPQQNGVLEGKHRHILEVARSLKIKSSVPVTFWGESVKTATYLINRLPTAVLDGKTPYELLYGEVPKLDHLRVFGCLSYASNLPGGDKLDARTRRAVLPGYSDT
ncbi:PREDICTED: uncharacterized protein LOC109210914 [Nicotiana attenuata]|uniref:uncharacterized protein LOC109210914 n=1 Tax=Nicotiana attenuata TaxID=49451 RepID=UPI0009055AC9|nr:PREDICTED: uncharacterized protein LOC109210914 [Nicotiana attenuata]